MTEPARGAAFLLAQVGARAAERFGERVAEHGLTRPQSGILGVLAGAPRISQQQLAERLGMLPSRVVAFVDELESAGLIQRIRDEADRRRNALVLTDAGKAALQTVAQVARSHEADISEPLSEREHQQLIKFLRRIAEHQDLTPGVHPGYASLRAADARR